MKVTLDREGKNLVKLDVELDSARAVKAYEQACRQISQRVNIPGFRKGKAPRGVLEKTFGIDYIKQEALEKLLPEVLNEVIVQESLDIITQPEINSCDFNLGEPLKLQAKFEVRPIVTLGDYKGIRAEIPEAKLPEGSIEKALNSLAESRADMKAIPSRPIVLQDTVLLNFECYIDDKLVEGGKADGLVLEVKEGNFLEGFAEQLVDKQPGDKLDIKAQFPNNYRNRELAGKNAIFKTEIVELRERVMPPLDDNLAAYFGHQSLSQLKEAIEERLIDEVAQENEVRKHRIVIEKIVEQAQVDIPESMIEREQELLLTQMKRYIESNKQNWAEVENSDQYADLKAAKLEEARQRVLTSLVLGAIVKAENVSITAEEVEPYLAEVAARYNISTEKAVQNEQLRRQIMEEVLTNKVVDLVVQQAEIVFVEGPSLEVDPAIKENEKQNSLEPAEASGELDSKLTKRSQTATAEKKK